jgi:hypothetical protein
VRKDVEAPKNGQKLVEEVKKIQILKFDSISLTNESLVDKENSILKKYIQNQIFMDSIKFYRGFN